MSVLERSYSTHLNILTLRSCNFPSAPYCISLLHPKPYFQLNLVHLTRVKGLRILRVAHPTHDDGDFGLRLMYSIDGCKWKIFGAKPKLPRVIISNATNGISVNPEIKQVSYFWVGGQ